MSRLVEVTKTIIDYDDIYHLYSKEIVDLCKVLSENYNETLHQKVINDIQTLVSSVGDRVGIVAGLETAIDSDIFLIGEDKKLFDRAYTDARNSKDADKKIWKNTKRLKWNLKMRLNIFQMSTPEQVLPGVLHWRLHRFVLHLGLLA